MKYNTYLEFDGEPQKTVWQQIWRVLRIFIFIFLIVSVAWGCGLLFTKRFNTYTITDVTGASSFRPGVFFEIIIQAIFGKAHHFYIGSSGSIYEYPLLAINSWQDAFVKTKSPFFGVFVYPIAWLLVKIIVAFGGYRKGGAVLGGIFMITFLIRLIALVTSFKYQMKHEKIQLIQAKQGALQAKYKGRKDKQSRQQLQAEIAALYRKEGINPLGAAIGNAIGTMPFFVAMYTVIRTTQTLKLTKIGAIYLVRGIWTEATKEHHWVYFSLLAVYLPMQLFTTLLPTILNWKKRAHMSMAQKKAQNKQIMIQSGMILVYLIIAARINAGAVIYWIISSSIQGLQTTFFHYFRLFKRKKKQQTNVDSQANQQLQILQKGADMLKNKKNSQTKSLSPNKNKKSFRWL